MNLQEATERYKKAINRKFTVQEIIEILEPLGVDAHVITSIIDLSAKRDHQDE